MDIIKSLLVLVFLLGLTGLALCSIIQCVKKSKTGILRKKDIIKSVCITSCAVLCISLFGDYIYPFERRLEPVLVAEFEVPEEYELDYPGQQFWHGAYAQFGLYAESFYFNPEDTSSIYGFDWPPMNFERYSYIITYGQEIESLSYCVWDTIDLPVRTGAKVGYMTLSDDFSPEKVYVYRIPRIRIENDVNNVSAFRSDSSKS